MHREVVQVVAVNEGGVKIKFNKQKMCSCCRYAFLCGDAKEEISINNHQDLFLACGDKIEIGISGKRTALASLILFLAPAVVFLLALLILRRISPFLSFSLAVLAVFTYYVIIKNALKGKEEYFHLKILGKL